MQRTNVEEEKWVDLLNQGITAYNILELDKLKLDELDKEEARRQIVEAYRRLSLKYHPDKFTVNAALSPIHRALEDFRYFQTESKDSNFLWNALHQAYLLLMNENQDLKKDRYDTLLGVASLRSRRERFSTASTRPSAPTSERQSTPNHPSTSSSNVSAEEFRKIREEIQRKAREEKKPRGGDSDEEFEKYMEGLKRDRKRKDSERRREQESVARSRMEAEREVERLEKIIKLKQDLIDAETTFTLKQDKLIGKFSTIWRNQKYWDYWRTRWDDKNRIIALLENYIKGSTPLFPNLTRHHIKEVRDICQSGKDAKQMLKDLKKIDLKNSKGHLATLILYISKKLPALAVEAEEELIQERSNRKNGKSK